MFKNSMELEDLFKQFLNLQDKPVSEKPKLTSAALERHRLRYEKITKLWCAALAKGSKLENSDKQLVIKVGSDIKELPECFAKWQQEDKKCCLFDDLTDETCALFLKPWEVQFRGKTSYWCVSVVYSFILTLLLCLISFSSQHWFRKSQAQGKSKKSHDSC